MRKLPFRPAPSVMILGLVVTACVSSPTGTKAPVQRRVSSGGTTVLKAGPSPSGGSTSAPTDGPMTPSPTTQATPSGSATATATPAASATATPDASGTTKPNASTSATSTALPTLPPDPYASPSPSTSPTPTPPPGMTATSFLKGLTAPAGIAGDASGNLYVCERDPGDRVLKVTPNASYTVYAGPALGVSGATGCINGTSGVRFDNPTGIAVDSKGDVFVADTANDVIREIPPNGQVSTFAGTANKPGKQDQTGLQASFNAPTGLTIDKQDNLYVADTGNNLIRKITPAGVVSTIGGTGAADYTGDGGQALAATFDAPAGVLADGIGDVFVDDTGNNVIREISWQGVVTTVAGESLGPSAPIQGGFADGPGGSALFKTAHALVIDRLGNLIVADTDNHVLRYLALDQKPTSQTFVTTVCGDHTQTGDADGTAGAASFAAPYGLAYASGTLYLSDSTNGDLRTLK